METKEKFDENINDYSTSKKETEIKKNVNKDNTITNEKETREVVETEQFNNNANSKVVTTRSGRTVRRPQYYQAV